VFKAGVYAPNTSAWDNERRPPSIFGLVPGAGVMIDRGDRGRLYSAVRGEILRPSEEKLVRRHPTRAFSLIKNESSGIEDDQIPS